jgi:hypothetical protein
VVGVDWYEFAMVELTIKHSLGQAWLIPVYHLVELLKPSKDMQKSKKVVWIASA